jgi:hypothetical protein
MSNKGRPHLKGEERRRLTEQAIDLYTSGHTIQQIAREIGRPYESTRVLLIKARITIRRPGTYDRSALRRNTR